MLENRKMMMRLFPELFHNQPIAPVERYPALCCRPCARAARWTTPAWW